MFRVNIVERKDRPHEILKPAGDEYYPTFGLLLLLIKLLCSTGKCNYESFIDTSTL